MQIHPIAVIAFLLMPFVALAIVLLAIGCFREDTQPAAAEKLPPDQQAAIKDALRTVNEWIAWNDWYLIDQALALEAQSIHFARQKTHPGEELADNLAAVSAEMWRRHKDLKPTTN